jgi:TolB-like protein/DNA-binding winged helix-turn-helix (wHTH) protein/lipopolysaccharide biosynthesis regulator YciM
MNRAGSKQFEFGAFILDPGEHLLLRDGQSVNITPKAFDLLAVLVENRGRLMTKEALLEQVWPDSFVEEANLSVKMSELRRALGEAPNANQYIETVPRKGYRFVAEVAEKPSEATSQSTLLPVDNVASGLDETASDQKVDAFPVPRRTNYGWVVAAAAVVLIGLAVAWFARGRIFGSTETRPIRSLAVLPMTDLSGDSTQDYFADGMTETLISGLARVGALRVISRTSVMQYKGAQKQVPEIGRELNVDAIIEGSVQRSGDRVKIDVKMVDAQNDHYIWSETYDRQLSDILSLQNEIARAVTQAVQVKLTPQEENRLKTSTTIDPAAYDYLLRGRYYFNHQTKADNEKAIEMFDQAVAADPNFASAHAALAQACVWRFFLFTPDEKQWEEKAFVAVEKALSLDSDLAEAHLARGRLLWTPSNNFPHDKAISEYKRALELNPNLDEARNQLALVYSHVGLLDRSLEELRMAVAINPGNTVARYRIGESHLFKGEYDQALEAFRSVPREANPALIGYQTAWALFHLGKRDEAAKTLEEFLRDFPEDNGGLYTSVQAVLAASAGRIDEAEKKIAAAVEKGKGFGHFHHTAFHIACAYALMNRPDLTIEWLKRASDGGFPCYPLFLNDSSLDGVRADPRFQSMIDEIRKRSETY